MKLPSLALFGLLSLPSLEQAAQGMVWNRIATFLTCTQDDQACNTNDATVSEIVSVTPDGRTLVYTDSPDERIGFVDIAGDAAAAPMADGIVDLPGEPTAVTVTPDGLFALVGVNTSPNFTDPSGALIVVDMAERTITATIDAQGQPDSVAVSPDGAYIALVIENERDEDLGDGAPPQLPAGFIWVVNTNSSGAMMNDPSTWTTTKVELTNFTDMKFPQDAEPEFVDINADNVAIVTLQENNYLVVIDLATATILDAYPAGTVSVTQIDTEEEDIIDQSSGSITDLPREPDAVTWIGTDNYATANEGDLEGGTRGFTIYDRDGTVVYDSGNTLEHLAVRYGHYPEGRSENKGAEPEGILYFTASDGAGFLVVLLERAGCAMVFTLSDTADIANNPPVFAQVLPTLMRPEGIVKIPGRDILAISCEEDDREIQARAGIVLYEYQDFDVPTYPALVAADREDGTPIAFSALSGLAAANPLGFPESTRRLAGHAAMDVLYTVEDSAFDKSRIFQINVGEFPYVIEKETRMVDSNDILSAAFPEIEFNNYTLVNDDKTVNMDPEGIAVSYTGGFWVANEGRGTVGDEGRPIEMNNFIVKVDDDGNITQVITLPEERNAIQVRYGFEGIAEQGDYLVVAVQRAWDDEEHPRIGIYNTADEGWKFVYYPLDAVESQNGGWVGLSDISPLGGGRFLVLERDNKAGPDAAIKRIYEISLGEDFDVQADTVLEKTLVYDLMPTLESLNGYTYEKIEGMAVTESGHVWINNDNDGVDDNSGEQFLFALEDIDLSTEDDGTAAPSASTAAPTASPNAADPPSASHYMHHVLSIVLGAALVAIVMH